MSFSEDFKNTLLNRRKISICIRNNMDLIYTTDKIFTGENPYLIIISNINWKIPHVHVNQVIFSIFYMHNHKM